MKDAAYKGIVLGAIAALVMLSNPVLAQWGRSAGASLLASSVCLLSGGANCTMTGQTIYSGVTTDITTGTNEDLKLTANGTGLVIASDGAGSGGVAASDVGFRVSTAAGAAALDLIPGGSGYGVIKGAGSGIGTVRFGNDTGIGSYTSVANNTVSGYIGKTMTPGSGGTYLVAGYGGGAIGFPTQQAVTIADDAAGTSPTDTTSPTSSQIEVTCNDANGCNYNPGETSVVDGWQIMICNLSAANVVTVNDSAGVVAVRGGATAALDAGDCISCAYTGAIWGCG